MSSDLVTRLREEAECYRGKTQSCLTDAADRIERLEAALRHVVYNDQIDAYGPSGCASLDLARDILEGKDG